MKFANIFIKILLKIEHLFTFSTYGILNQYHGWVFYCGKICDCIKIQQFVYLNIYNIPTLILFRTLIDNRQKSFVSYHSLGITLLKEKKKEEILGIKKNSFSFPQYNSKKLASFLAVQFCRENLIDFRRLLIKSVAIIFNQIY